MDRKLKLGLVGLAMMGCALGGCVESDQSVVMLGSVIGEASEDDEGGGVTCEFSAEIEEVDIRTGGTIDLADLEATGQPLVDGGSGGTADVYNFVAVTENRLFDSRTVGAVSGGDGGGYQNLTLDKNDVFINTATVRLSPANNNFAFEGGGSQSFPEWERERQTNMLVTSGGGAATLDFPIIGGSSERRQFQTFFDNISGQLNDGESLDFIFEIQVHGETLAGNEVNSNILQYPITICDGCGSGTDGLCQLTE